MIKVSQYQGKNSKDIPIERIYFTDHDTHYAMFIANVNIHCPRLNKTLEIKDFYVGFSSAEEMIKSCNILLHERVFGYPKHEKYLLWPSPPPFSIVVFIIDILDGNGRTAVSEDTTPSEWRFSGATYQTIIRSKPKRNPPWLATLTIFLHLTDEGERLFYRLLSSSSH